MIRVDSECFEGVIKIYLKLLDLLGKENVRYYRVLNI